jgi:hypothetical protein
VNKIIDHIKKELLNVLPAFIFFLLMFHVLIVTKALVLKDYGITPENSAFAIIGALIVAKVILIFDRMPFLNLYPKRPLIWNVALKTVVFAVVTLAFLIIEETIHSARKYGGFASGVEHLKTDIAWSAFWAREIWLNILILFYCAAVELYRVVGFDKVKEIFFGSIKK